MLDSYRQVCGENEIIDYTNFDYENLKFLYFNDTFIAGKEENSNDNFNNIVNTTEVSPVTPVVTTASYQITNAYENDNILTFEIKYNGQLDVYKYIFEKVNDNYYFNKIVK